MRTNRGIAAVLAVVVVLLALTGCARTVAGTPAPAPGAGGAVRVGTGAQSITIFLDFRCPACKNFENRWGADISAAVREGRLTVEYRPVSFLDRVSAGGDYSSRALRAFLSVGAGSDDPVVLAFGSALFAAQPAEGAGPEPTDARLADLAATAGAPARVVTTIRDGSTGIDGKAVGAANLTRLHAAGGPGTPTVLHDGERVAHDDPGWLRQVLAD